MTYFKVFPDINTKLIWLLKMCFFSCCFSKCQAHVFHIFPTALTQARLTSNILSPSHFFWGWGKEEAFQNLFYLGSNQGKSPLFPNVKFLRVSLSQTTYWIIWNLLWRKRISQQVLWESFCFNRIKTRVKVFIYALSQLWLTYYHFEDL